jgi:hemerythrin
MIRQLALVVLAAGLAACPMYDQPPQRLRAPPPVTAKGKDKDPRPPAPPVPVYIEDCNMPRSATVASRNTKEAVARLNEGDVRLADAQKQPADSEARAIAIKESLEKYRDAVAKDHFHAEATLMLARTYDTFHRKGCALKMLQRIGEMRKNKAFKDAERVGRDVENNAKVWFATYHAAAIDAVTP